MITIHNTIAVPKHLTPSNILEFLDRFAPIFNMIERKEPGYIIDLSKIDKLSMLGTLLIYKIVEFTFNNKCFLQPIMRMPKGTVVIDFEKFGFWDLIMDYMIDRHGVEKSYRKLEVKIEDDFIIAPQALLRDSNFSANALKENFLPRIESYYQSSPKAVSMIFLCLSEVLLNFWEHAVDDSKSIIVANGNKHTIEIACADTGKGIISTLKDTIVNKSNKIAPVLAKSVEKGITSKKHTNHMGYGLWVLDQIVIAVKGRLHIYSEGAFYHNDYGKVKTGECAYWGGTIVYLSLPLNNPKTWSDIEDEKEKAKFANLKINWE